MAVIATKEAARFDTKEFSLAPTTKHVTFLLCIVSLMCLNTVTLASSGQSVAQYQPRNKRSLFQLCEIISVYTRRSCLNYNNYGCHCGFGASTARPVDDVDNCCRLHDICYAGSSSICFLRPHWVTYDKHCTATSCTCTDARSTCDFYACSCDLALAQCFRTATYNRRYKNWSSAACNAS
ncbi:hypothetical protein BsWGS_16285 [Bradybaena similaris]